MPKARSRQFSKKRVHCDTIKKLMLLPVPRRVSSILESSVSTIPEEFTVATVGKMYLLKNPVAVCSVDIPLTTSAFSKALTVETDNPNHQLDDKSQGFGRGLQAQKIAGATDCGGELCLWMEWHGSIVCDLVTAREANVKCPQIVIQYYESRWNKTRLEKDRMPSSP